jgi:hypothetical protein
MRIRQQVRSGLEPTGQIEGGGTKHVFAMAYRLAVEPKIGNGVQSLTNQQDAASGRR